MGIRRVNPAGFETLREVAAASLTAGYAQVGSALAQSAAIVIISNSLNGDVYVSFDGTNDHIWLDNGMDLVLDLSNSNMVLSKASSIYVKDGDVLAATTGKVTFTLIYHD